MTGGIVVGECINCRAVEKKKVAVHITLIHLINRFNVNTDIVKFTDVHAMGLLSKWEVLHDLIGGE